MTESAWDLRVLVSFGATALRTPPADAHVAKGAVAAQAAPSSRPTPSNRGAEQRFSGPWSHFGNGVRRQDWSRPGPAARDAGCEAATRVRLDGLAAAGSADGHARDQLGTADGPEGVDAVRGAALGERRLCRGVRANCPHEAGEAGCDCDRGRGGADLERPERPADALRERDRALELLQRSRTQRKRQLGQLGPELTARAALFEMRLEPCGLELRELTVELERDELSGFPALRDNLPHCSHTEFDGIDVP